MAFDSSAAASFTSGPRVSPAGGVVLLVCASGSYAVAFGLVTLFAAAGFALLVLTATRAHREIAGQHG